MRLIDANELKGEKIRVSSKMLDGEKPTLEQEPRKDEWIPCSERMPDIEQDVLATTTLFGIREVTFAWRINDGEWLIREGSAEATNNDILAWMPLPMPYREDGES